MAASTWQNITTGMSEATYKSYMRKSSHQRKRREVAEAWCDFQNFCQKAEEEEMIRKQFNIPKLTL